MQYRISKAPVPKFTSQQNSVNFSTRLCPDQYLCQISFNQVTQKWGITNTRDICSRRFSHAINKRKYVDYSSIPPNGYYLIIVLESPHKDEYDNKGMAYGPVQGTSGCNICSYLNDCLNKAPTSNNQIPLNQSYDYQVVVINAVQFQASTGTCPLNRVLTNNNWKKVFKDKKACDLDRRLKRFLNNSNHCVICNCCTNVGGSNLKRMVKRKLADCGIISLTGCHPASWNRESHRKIW